VTVIRGERPLVLVAPHGGRRDPARRPWGHDRLRMNDLHTASLTAELAALAGAAALVNDEHDRNEVDLNRVSEANDRAPWFLERLADLLESALAGRGRVTLVTVHGWNVVQPAVDVGLGCAPASEPFAVGPGSAVSPAFAARALPRFVAACAERGIAATVGARYPARARENLVQLFTPRYREDRRPLVRALAALAPRVDALQLELGIALRWPGAWRRRLLEACAAALPALLAPLDGEPPPTGPLGAAAAPPGACRLEFVAPSLCGLIGVEATLGLSLSVTRPSGSVTCSTNVGRIIWPPLATAAATSAIWSGVARSCPSAPPCPIATRPTSKPDVTRWPPEL